MTNRLNKNKKMHKYDNMKKHIVDISECYELLIGTPLGEMVAIASNTHLLYLGFKGQKGLDRSYAKIKRLTKSEVVKGENPILQKLALELDLYFKGQLQSFQTPLYPYGTDFQEKVWTVLKSIPYGKTIAYKDQAIQMEKPKALRAIGSANGANPFTIVVPCHRVIAQDGGLGGYAGGLDKKRWLLDHELRVLNASN